MTYVTLNNGVKMPQLGYGVYQTPAEETERCVLAAIKNGYRSIDTAQAYGNEEGVGNAIAKCGLPREELFITTKIWITNAGYEKAKASIEESLKKLKSDYVDLLLIHQPFGDYCGTYRAMEEAYKAGKARAIGVSNFYPDRFIDIAHFAEVKPAVNQVENHVFQQQKAAKKYLAKCGTQLMSWGPFAEGRNDFFNTPALVEIGAKYGKLHRYGLVVFSAEKLFGSGSRHFYPVQLQRVLTVPVPAVAEPSLAVHQLAYAGLSLLLSRIDLRLRVGILLSAGALRRELR